jgi:methylenetetrahydrofolate reductase (NADPH)
MHIHDIFESNPVTLSFEFFPPKSDKAAAALFDTIADLEPLRPSFVSVTYGAGGSTRELTHDLVVRLHRETALDPIPHLTCVCHGEEDIHQILTRYAEAGISNILALGGDAPKGLEGYRPEDDAFQHASDLVRFIRRFNESGVHPDPRGFGVGVACFPEGHPATPNSLLEMDYLKAKVDSGADYMVTQLFFDNRDFYDFRERCELAGIEVPIIAGIMPISNISGMRRMAELAAGARFPAPLLRALERVKDDPASVESVGIHWAAEQSRDLIDQGVRGIHYYTLNKSQASRKIYETLGLQEKEPA